MISPSADSDQPPVVLQVSIDNADVVGRFYTGLGALQLPGLGGRNSVITGRLGDTAFQLLQIPDKQLPPAVQQIRIAVPNVQDLIRRGRQFGAKVKTNGSEVTLEGPSGHRVILTQGSIPADRM